MKQIIVVIFLGTVCLGQQTPELTIPAIFAEGGITGRAPEAVKWSPDGKKISYLLRDDQGEKAELDYVDAATGKTGVLVAADKLKQWTPPLSQTKDDRERDNRLRYHVSPYHWAPDSQHLLFDTFGHLWLYSLATGTAIELSSSGDPMRNPKFSPDGARLSYIRNHNLYVRPIEGGGETQLTDTKDANILNGEVDWVYAEELDVRSNYSWSHDGKRIVFLQMNETNVPVYPITDFIPQHPTVYEEKYPKVGDPNPEVRLGVMDSHNGKTRWIHLSNDKDIYVPSFGWIRDGLIWAKVLNRAQNQLDLYFIDASSGQSRRVLRETSDTWIEMDDNFQVLKPGNRFLWTSWRDGHTHVYVYSFDQNEPLKSDAQLDHQVTKGDFEVFGVEAIDEDAGTLYFTANAADDRQRHLCSVKLDGSDFKILTGNQPGTHEVNFGANAKTYLDDFSALMTPPQLSLCQVSAGCQAFWQSRSIAPYKLATPQFVDFSADDGTVLRGLLFLPPDARGKVPLLMNPYGGPHGQVVRDQWAGTGILFNEVLLRDGIAVLQVDNRGMGARGKKFAAVVQHKFGETELKDQLAALDQALVKFPQLDGSRLGWWGWSYGGYMTLNAMTHSDRFKAGVSVAPVTDWRDYDSIYTERYGGLVPEFDAAYKKSSPVNYAGQLHGKLLEVHGTSDDNVHMQNTIQMINAFISAGKQFDLLLYPRKTHAIAGPVTRTHLFVRIRRHFLRELRGGETPE
ncbi:MAG TPA: S9 family peptidase [Verrucomicrobiae bacterium]|nr:S9 family peptidase [Verrucomicrobiae bacterium]